MLAAHDPILYPAADTRPKLGAALRRFQAFLLDSPIADLIDQLGAEVSPADVAVLERMMGVEAPPQERLEFLGG